MADDSSSSGGLLGNPDLLMNLGMGLMAGSRFGSNAGMGLMQGMQSYQGQRAANQDYQIKAYQLQRQKAMNDMLQGLMGGGQAQQQPDQSQPPPQSAAAPGGAAPASAPAGPSWLTPPNVGNMPVGGMNAKAAQLYSIMSGKDPLQAASEVRTQQMAAAQQQVAPALAKLDTVIKSAKPSQYVAADPELSQAWAALAPHAGFDPVNDMNDDNLRTALTLGRNQLSAAVGKESYTPPVKEQQIQGPLGAQYSRDPITGKISQEVAPQETAQFTMPDGSVKMMTKAEGMRQGLTPFNPTLFNAGAITDQAKEQAYQRFKVTGEMPASGRGGAAAQIAYANYFAKRAADDGDTGAQQAARSQQYKASQGVVKDFTSGATAKTINGLNTAIGHMDLLDQAATNLNNTDVQFVNKVKNVVGQQFGRTAANNFNVIRDFAAGEVAKAVLPGGGGEAERTEIANAIKSSGTPDQLHQAIGTWRDLLASKTDSLRGQWDNGTNGLQGSFDKFLLPDTKKALGIADTAPGSAPKANTPPARNAQGWILHKDGQGRMAYVSPDGKQFTPVK